LSLHTRADVQPTTSIVSLGSTQESARPVCTGVVATLFVFLSITTSPHTCISLQSCTLYTRYPRHARAARPREPACTLLGWRGTCACDIWPWIRHPSSVKPVWPMDCATTHESCYVESSLRSGTSEADRAMEPWCFCFSLCAFSAIFRLAFCTRHSKLYVRRRWGSSLELSHGASSRSA